MIGKLAAITFLGRDYDEAKNWFVNQLNFKLIEDIDLGDDKRWVLVSHSGTQGSYLLLAKADGAEQIAQIGHAAGGRVAFFLHTESFQRDHARMTAAGIKFNEPPRHESYGTVAVFEDLYGNLWDLIEPRASIN